jgi:Na+/citrate or Na+/malate symporter
LYLKLKPRIPKKNQKTPSLFLEKERFFYIFIAALLFFSLIGIASKITSLTIATIMTKKIFKRGCK